MSTKAHKRIVTRPETQMRTTGYLVRQHAALPLDMRQTVTKILGRYEIHTEREMNTFLRDTLEVVIRAVECKAGCCKEKTREQRLAEL